MYTILIENGEVDHNETLKDSGYLMDDITNGIFTHLSFVRTKAEVRKFVKMAREAEGKVEGPASKFFTVTVYKMEKISIP